ncbi:MAG: hypothetical protein QM726_09170 [Chitinophagaceae bacterium]
MRKLFVVFIALATLYTAANSQSLTRLANDKKYVIPFQLTEHNNWSVAVVINNKDSLHLMLHTAVSDVNLTTEAVKHMSSLQFQRTDSVKSWGGNGNTSRFSADNFMQLAGMSWQHVQIWEDENSGQQTDGKFGLNLFADRVVEIDFDEQQITISKELPRKVRKYQQLKLFFENDNLFVEMACNTGAGIVQNKFLLHSGYAGSLLFDDKFAAENKLGDALAITGEKQLKDSYGHVLKVKRATLPSLLIGSAKLDSVPVGFFEGAIGRQKLSVVGGDLLKRFNIIIDAKREYIYLKPNHLKNSNYLNV